MDPTPIDLKSFNQQWSTSETEIRPHKGGQSDISDRVRIILDVMTRVKDKIDSPISSLGRI